MRYSISYIIEYFSKYFVFDQSYDFVDWIKVEEGNDNAWETIDKKEQKTGNYKAARLRVEDRDKLHCSFFT